ncbi:hypothetical protein FisN_29Hh014 [Fistulifera solaris]|uniref:Uncharacterized protein n=1 Tax=Fistulifera solaris TaxID=1519565 RepID=A0A1Z5K5Z9_FISSO|nr:hypothetical protein FisN_29Hh014 [Fistulifera solaris]|eukprot:GAX21582.1 hypothetical protein FisN_29Hh014 [Fistulifera solaris]
MNDTLESGLSFHKRAREDETENDTVSSTATDGSFSEDNSENSESSSDSIYQAYRSLQEASALYALAPARMGRLRDVASHNNLPLLAHAISTDPANTQAVVSRQRSEANLLAPARKKMVYAIQTTSSVPKEQQSASPFQLLQEMYKERGINMNKQSYESQPDWMPWNVDGYTADLTKTIRENDVATIRRLKEKGQNLQCSNKFGESVVHTAARRGSYDVLRCLVQEAKISIRVCCDSGRNPLHDSCWTGQPQFDCVRLLLQEEPSLLVTMDKRGFTPLEYVPRDAYPLWTRFLKNNPDLLPFSR